jgi:hypothetical protein
METQTFLFAIILLVGGPAIDVFHAVWELLRHSISNIKEYSV